jgi:hypothetical protein
MPVLREHPKAETANAHARLESLPFFRALHAGDLPKPAIVSLLRSLSLVNTLDQRPEMPC